MKGLHWSNCSINIQILRILNLKVIVIEDLFKTHVN